MANKIEYEERKDVYRNAVAKWGATMQSVVAIEELSELQKELCKTIRGTADYEHLAEEIADATIMLEQLRMIYDLNDLVCHKMDEKIERLNRRLGDR